LVVNRQLGCAASGHAAPEGPKASSTAGNCHRRHRAALFPAEAPPAPGRHPSRQTLPGRRCRLAAGPRRQGPWATQHRCG